MLYWDYVTLGSQLFINVQVRAVNSVRELKIVGVRVVQHIGANELGPRERALMLIFLVSGLNYISEFKKTHNPGPKSLVVFLHMHALT